MRILFLDTNVFIQCRNLNQLPWDIFSDGEGQLMLYIPREVQIEIDRHKQNGNTRRSKRARKANSLFRKIILTEDLKLQIKDSAPEVYIGFPPAITQDFTHPYALDKSHPDDRMISEILNYQTEFPNHNIALLTHDTNPLLTAKRCDLACEVIPDDWLLDPEPDPRDRQINELRNRIDKLQKKCPNIDATWISEDGDETKCLSISMVEFKSLDDIQIDELINIVKKRYPMKTDFPKKEKYTQLPLDLKNIKSFDSLKDQFPKYKPPSAHEIKNYQENKYPDWLALVEKHLRNLSSRLEDPFRFFSFFLSLSNNGNYPAENIVIEFKIFGGLNFWPFERGIKDQESNKIPSPPIPPKGKWVTSNSIYEASMKFAKPWQYPQNNILKDSFLNQIPDFPKPRDKNSFYWKSEKSKNTLTAGCEEFRHQVNSEIFELTVAIPTSEKGIEKCKVECIISAKNMVNPIKKYLDLIISYNEGDTWGEAKKQLSSI